MLGKHRFGFTTMLVVVLGLVSTTLAGAQTNIYLPLAALVEFLKSLGDVAVRHR